MEQGGISKDAVEHACRQLQHEKVLLPHFAAGIGACHLGKAGGAVEPDGTVTHVGEGLEVAPGSTAEVQDGGGRDGFDVSKQRGNVLCDVMVSRSRPKGVGLGVVVGQGVGGDLPECLFIHTCHLYIRKHCQLVSE